MSFRRAHRRFLGERERVCAEKSHSCIAESWLLRSRVGADLLRHMRQRCPQRVCEEAADQYAVQAPDQSGGDMNDDTERIHVQGFFPSRWLEVRENCAGFGLPACH